MVDTYCSMMSLVAAPAHARCVTLPLLQPTKLLCKIPSTGAANNDTTYRMHQMRASLSVNGRGGGGGGGGGGGSFLAPSWLPRKKKNTIYKPTN